MKKTKKNLEMVREVLKRIRELGVEFSFNPAGYGMCGVSFDHLEEAIFSTSKYPLQQRQLGISEEDYQSYMNWFDNGQLCMGKYKNGNPCGHYLWIDPRFSAKILEIAFCHKHKGQAELNRESSLHPSKSREFAKNKSCTDTV